MTTDSADSGERQQLADTCWRAVLAHTRACSTCEPDEFCSVGSQLAGAWHRAVVEGRGSRAGGASS